MNTFERLADLSTEGHGETVRQLPVNHFLRQFTTPLGTPAEHRVHLTPASQNTIHPLTGRIDTDVAYRAPYDWRSFSITTEQDMPASLTVKGGDFAYMAMLQRTGYADMLLGRLAKGQIPGGSQLAECHNEFSAAVTLQEMAYAALGRITHTAIPIAIQTITHLKMGTQTVPLRDYLNSAAYFDLPQSWRQFLTMQEHEGLGEFLLHRFENTPAQYTYATAGYNIRINTLNGSRLFRQSDNSRTPRDIYNEPLTDLLMFQDSDFQFMGDHIPAVLGRKGTVIRNIYHILGDGYGFNADDILPDTAISDTNYLEVLNTIKRRCQSTGSAAIALASFSARLTEVAALAHANGHTFSADHQIGSSFMPRNVTYEGTVLDLDTFGPFVREPADHLEQDLHELMLSVAHMERLTCATYPDGLLSRVADQYMQNLQEFGAPATWMQQAATIFAQSQRIGETADRLRMGH